MKYMILLLLLTGCGKIKHVHHHTMEMNAIQECAIMIEYGEEIYKECIGNLKFPQDPD